MRKIYSLSQTSRIIQKLKNQGQRIVLVNGCFDLIHVGHIRYLKESKIKGDILVCALNSDASVQRLKGTGRPILDAQERAEILSAFSCVDYITVFKEDNVERVLLALQPEIHAKGSDYTKDSVPEKDTVRSYGGKVAITGGPKIRSTSDLITSIAARFKDNSSKRTGKKKGISSILCE